MERTDFRSIGRSAQETLRGPATRISPAKSERADAGSDPAGQKFSTGMIAAVSNRGLMRFKLQAGALSVDPSVGSDDFI